MYINKIMASINLYKFKLELLLSNGEVKEFNYDACVIPEDGEHIITFICKNNHIQGINLINSNNLCINLYEHEYEINSF